MSRDKKIFAALRRLLSPRLESCLVCGRSARVGASLPLLCEYCAAKVPRIVEPRCPICGRAHGCPDCLRPEALLRAFVLNRSAVLYDTVMREWIAEYKYGAREGFAEPFSILLEQTYQRMRRELSKPFPQSGPFASPLSVFDSSRRSSVWNADWITWVPLSAERLEERGFNQAERLGRLLAGRLRLPAGELLARTVHTGKQSFKTRAERLRNLEGAFCLAPNLDPRFFKQWDSIGNRKDPQGSFPIRILLIDDIYTTGTTAAVCASVLKTLETGFKRPVLVYSLTLARS
ncbi:ComF family protein [Saccharibacillus deserti]|uniref:ComF family protein n=1 Tax=Saccharibacillus deserti TaxID=1634444 RepID=UPI001553ED92|nr:ComF family protein [Saccharibacillus deserti]